MRVSEIGYPLFFLYIQQYKCYQNQSHSNPLFLTEFFLENQQPGHTNYNNGCNTKGWEYNDCCNIIQCFQQEACRKIIWNPKKDPE